MRSGHVRANVTLLDQLAGGIRGGGIQRHNDHQRPADELLHLVDTAWPFLTNVLPGLRQGGGWNGECQAADCGSFNEGRSVEAEPATEFDKGAGI
ncbi:hypothetical protein ACFQX6_66945 [Streptosporangium lutulentum]